MTHHFSILDILLIVARYALATAVTIHVLRTKQNTAASTGWIGIAWLMPLTGAILYVMFGVNRVRRLAQRLVRDHQWDGRGAIAHQRERIEGQFAPLARMLGRLTERPLLRGNAIQCLHDGDNAYPVMLDAIDSATQSVLLCSYIFRADKVGARFIAALAHAQKRGVEVRVLVDGIGSGYFHSGVVTALARQNVACRRFMHSVWPWRMPFINLRNHRKILVVDGKTGFMGGLNIGEENMLRLRTKLPVADTHFQVTGPIVHQLTEAFARDWSFTTGEELDGSRYFPELEPVGDIPMRIVTSGPDNDLEKIELGMLQGVALAKRSVRVMTPYFLPDDRLASELCLAALRGTVIDIVVPGSSNHHLIDYARDANLAQFLDAGCRIWMANPPFNHAKLLIVDEEWSFVGSSNIDVRSLRLNFEINMEIYSTAFAEELSAFIDGHKHVRLTHHSLDRRSEIVKLRNAAVRLFMPYL